MSARDGKSFGVDAAMIHCRHAAEVSQRCVTRVSTADLQSGQEVQSGSVHYKHLDGREGAALQRGTALVGRPIKAKAIQLCLN